MILLPIHKYGCIFFYVIFLKNDSKLATEIDFAVKFGRADP